MAKDLLTAKAVEKAKPSAKPHKLSDGGGLFLLVNPKTQKNPEGSKLWRLKFRLNGKEGLFAIGRFESAPPGETEEQARARRGAGNLTLTEARDARDAARALIKRGINPADQRQDDKLENVRKGTQRRLEADGAFGKVASAWLENAKSGKGKTWAANTKRSKRARVERFLLPKLAALPISQIDAKQIRPILLQANAGAWSAIHVRGDLSAIFDYAVKRGFAESNPMPGLRGLVTMPESESKAKLTLAQIREFFTKLRAYRGFPETAFCLRLIALTASRPGEATDAEWGEFDLQAGLWRRPAVKMKARRDHVCPLSDQTISLLDQLRPITGSGRYLFPHRSKDTHADPARLRYAMRDLNLGRGASPHCWRTTFSTWANENGFRPDAIERQLAHVESNRVRATYNKALLVEERRKLMQAWADYLTAAESQNIVPLRAA